MIEFVIFFNSRKNSPLLSLGEVFVYYPLFHDDIAFVLVIVISIITNDNVHFLNLI